MMFWFLFLYKGGIIMGDPLYLIAYVLLGAVAGMIYALRRIFKLEQTILEMEKRILSAMARSKVRAVAKRVRKPKKKKGKKKAKKKVVKKKAKKKRR